MIELFKRLLNEPATARKFLVAIVGAVAVAVSVGLLPATLAPWFAVASAFLSSFGVYAVPNAATGRPVEKLKATINGGVT